MELSHLPLASIWDEPDLESVFDPFDYGQRMTAYRLMIEGSQRARNDPAGLSSSPLWGLAFQHQWQYDSKRLGSPPADDPRRIDPASAWGFGNYTLCVIPWLGAVAAGVVDDLAISDPPPGGRFDYVEAGVVPAYLRPAVDSWTEFFSVIGDEATPLDQARERMWAAHKFSLDAAAERLISAGPGAEPPTEFTFLLGWCRMVDYLWAANWPTDLAFMTEHGLDVLPPHVLTDGSLDQLDDDVRRNVANVLDLARRPQWRARWELAAWRRAMTTDTARAEVVELLDAVFNPTAENRRTRLRLLGHLVRG